MYNVKANVLDDKVKTIATNSVPSNVAIATEFTANTKAYKSISIIQPRFIREPISDTAVTSVNYPNILATDVVHPQTGNPLFYYHKIPKVTTTGKGLERYIAIADQNGNLVDKTQYYVVTTPTEVRIYTNVMNSSNTIYFVNAIFFKNTSRIGYVHEMLNVHKALEYNTDYTVTYSNGAYTLDKALYVTSDPDVMSPVLIPYDYDISIPWRLEIQPITMPNYTVSKSHVSIDAFKTNAIKLSDGIYRVNTYDASNIKDDNGYIESFDTYGYIYAPKAQGDTLSVTVIRRNNNQFIANIAGNSKFNIYCINNISVKLSTDRNDLQKIASIYVNRNAGILYTDVDQIGGGFEDSSSDTFKPTLFAKLSDMKLRTTADRSTYDATYPVSKGVIIAQLPTEYTASLGKGDSQRLTDTIAQSKAVGNEMLMIDSNGFEITKGYFAKTFDESARISDNANVPDPVEPQDMPMLTENAVAVLDSPYESALSTSDNVVSAFAKEYSNTTNIADSIQYTGNVNEYSDSASVNDSAFIDKVTTLTDAANTDHDVAY